MGKIIGPTRVTASLGRNPPPGTDLMAKNNMTQGISVFMGKNIHSRMHNLVSRGSPPTVGGTQNVYIIYIQPSLVAGKYVVSFLPLERVCVLQII